MLRKSLFLIALLLCLVPAMAQDEISQWASSASATSEFSDDKWSALQATGEPDTDECEDSATAWASREQDTLEELTVFFDDPVIPTEVNIHQNFGRGSITEIELIPNDGSRNIRMRGTADDEDDECPGVFSIRIDDVEDAVIGVVITVDQRDAGKWNEIDAVELIGVPTEDSSSSGNSGNSGNSDLTFGRSIECEGEVFDNGVEFTFIQMRVRSTYTVTAIGLNGFDPVLAVMTDDGDGLCSDDDATAATYGAYLPTTDEVDYSKNSAQVIFTNNDTGEAFRNVTFVVGGKNNEAGEFVLLLEGLTLSSADGLGDTISAYIAPAMARSETALTAYMISVTDVFDPWIGLVSADMEVLQDNDENYFSCDDAGYNSCWGDSTKMDGYGVSRSNGRVLPGGLKDAMITIQMDSSLEGAYINFLMSTIQGTYGDYIVAFHAGVAEP